MKERGMIFNDEMVRAILDGRKTQTRRIIDWRRTRPTEIAERDDGSKWPWSEDCENGGDYWHDCPFGEVGDRLWVREAFHIGCDGYSYRADNDWIGESRKNNSGFLGCNDRWTPSIHMPRRASRITLEITGVRVERLQDISEDAALAEGVQPLRGGYWRHYQPGWTQHQLSARGSFVTLWNSLYGDESWQDNPFVWVIEFRRVEGE